MAEKQTTTDSTATGEGKSLTCPLCRFVFEFLPPASENGNIRCFECSHDARPTYVDKHICPICRETTEDQPMVNLSCGHVICQQDFMKLGGIVKEVKMVPRAPDETASNNNNATQQQRRNNNNNDDDNEDYDDDDPMAAPMNFFRMLQEASRQQSMSNNFPPVPLPNGPLRNFGEGIRMVFPDGRSIAMGGGPRNFFDDGDDDDDNNNDGGEDPDMDDDDLPDLEERNGFASSEEDEPPPLN